MFDAISSRALVYNTCWEDPAVDRQALQMAAQDTLLVISYVLSMVPDWRRAVDNAVAMLTPGGTLGVVDFHVHDGKLASRFWRSWFGHDGMWLSAAHLPHLSSRWTR